MENGYITESSEDDEIQNTHINDINNDDINNDDKHNDKNNDKNTIIHSNKTSTTCFPCYKNRKKKYRKTNRCLSSTTLLANSLASTLTITGSSSPISPFTRHKYRHHRRSSNTKKHRHKHHDIHDNSQIYNNNQRDIHRDNGYDTDDEE